MWRTKYGVDNSGWWSKKSSYAHGVGCWKSIISDVDHLRSLVHYRVKNGLRILFWHDVCCGDQPLKFQLQDLFRMARLKEATVHEVVSWNDNRFH